MSMRSPRRRRKRLLDVEDAARTRTVPRGCEAAHWDAHNRRGPFSTAERYSIVDVIDPRRSLSAPTPVSRAEECGRGREGDVAFGDAPITKYHPRGPGLRLVKRYYYTCAGSPRGIGTRIHTRTPYPYIATAFFTVVFVNTPLNPDLATGFKTRKCNLNAILMRFRSKRARTNKPNEQCLS